MTTCVNPTNTVPGTQPYANFGAYPGMQPGNVFGATTPTQTFPGFINNPFPTNFNTPTWPPTQWPVNTVPFYGQQYYPGFPAVTNAFPVPTFNTTPWSNGVAFTPAPWTNTNPFVNTPWTNGYSNTPFSSYTPTFVPSWTNGYVAPTTTFNPIAGGNPFLNPALFNTPWTTTPFGGFPTPQTNPFAFTQNTPWQTPWNSNFNTVPFGSFGAAPFVGTYNTTPVTPGFVNPTTNGWSNVAAAINSLSQPTSWSPTNTTPFATTNTNVFNSTPWPNGFPTFGGFNPGTQVPFGFTPTFNGISPTPWSNSTPGFGFNTGGFNTPLGYSPFPTNFANTPWSNTIPIFGGFNPGAFIPTFPGNFGNPSTPGFNPTYPIGSTPTGTPAGVIPTTRTNIQNGDASYRNGV